MERGYLKRILGSWRIPAFVLLVIATHLLVESLVLEGFSRFTLFLVGSVISPLIVSTIMGGRKAWWAAATNGASLVLSISAFTVTNGWAAVEKDFMIFLLVLAFSLACGACGGSFHERLSRRFGGTIY